MTTRILVLGSLLATLLSSCGAPKNINYFQDLATDGQVSAVQLHKAQEIVLSANDRISITISSKDAELANLLNLPVVATRIGAQGAGAFSQSQAVSTYVVAPEGTIDFPVLGKLEIAGKTRHQVATYVKESLIARGVVMDPVVTVEIHNHYFSVMGEVARPGRYSMDRDKMTVLDALSQAGDLTIYGKRDRILVLREEGGVQRTYQLDLRSGEQVAHSPGYYLKQNDVIYVEPNVVRARQSTVNGNNVLSTSFWISLATLATSVALLIRK